MAVGGVSGGGNLDPWMAAMQSAQASSEAMLGMLDDVLDQAVQLNAMMLEAMAAASPAGTGGNVNTWA